MPKIFSEEDRIVIRGKLLDAGLSQLKTRRYRNISLDEVTAKAGIAKGTFYNFFPSKERFFYEIMQLIKERNREEFWALFQEGTPTKQEVQACLCRRYAEHKTVYDYFTPEEMNLIVRKLPEGDFGNDSVAFAKELMTHCGRTGDAIRPEVIVNMCNVLALTASNQEMLEPEGYAGTIDLLVGALVDYIFEEEA